MLRLRLVAALLVLVVVLPCRGAPPRLNPAEVLPGHQRDPKIPTPESFFGFPLGSRHLRHDQVIDYLEALAASSERLTRIPYAQSHGQRPLMVAAITSAARMKRLEEVQRARPQLTRMPERPLAADEPLVVYLGYSIHGDEASAMNAAPLVAYHLVSSKSPEVEQWLERSVFLLDPALNPDGIDRFANWANANRGRFASDRPIDREHNQPWPGGRTNYYWFDLNRDWLPVTHPESRGRIELFHDWKPNVVLDFHEMGGSSSYFFQPGIPARNNPRTPAENFQLTRRFADAHASKLDEATELFFTEERFDDFYYGKGSTYPDVHGAVGILFEQGSTRGLALRNDRTDRDFAATIANQVRTSLSSLEAAAKLGTELLEFQQAFYQGALERSARAGYSAFVLTGEASRVQAAKRLLAIHDVRSTIPAKSILVEGERYAAGTALVVPARQPEITFIESLFDDARTFPENIFYDVSTWYLPAALDLDLYKLTVDLPAGWEEASDEQKKPGFQREETAIGYAFAPQSLDAPRLVAGLHRLDADIRVATQPFRPTADGATSEFPTGTFVVLRQPNADRWSRLLDYLERATPSMAIDVLPLQSSLTVEGPDLGSDTLLQLPVCKPLLVVGAGTSAYTAGSLWHFFDVRLGQPTTLVDSGDFRSAKLDESSCVILPGGRYNNWNDSHARQLRDYLQAGGTVVAIESSANWLASKGLIELDSPKSDGPVEEPSEGQANRSSHFSQKYGDARDAKALESIAGAFFETEIDPTHPLAFGFPDAQVPVFRTSTRRYPRPSNPYQTAAIYTGVISGYVSEKNEQQLQQTAAVWGVPVGRGRIIVIADNPVFRGYTRGAERFLTNAVQVGPALKIPAP